ncbi:imidazolonepropionase-like amidohydrolase [Tamaricihabitans halophyticus]|uniref:Imidazolonepropionase-like amidohydrolase n=1 Tax=Tamaricihabitans halophyticus TaxID=1262583 RepID=A0A4R2QW21_9PSEU|nr:amidohydrolase family protein [Tamaricihabitans halophyticus]TCP54302.1 imidazolonepropionase-like amidohydrolase [Tamaricihabitans halophyticus]
MSMVLRHGMVWDGLASEPIPADLLLDDGVISGVYGVGKAPGGALEVALDGAFVVPGLVDSHVHLVWSGGPDPVRVVDSEGEQLTVVRAVANARAQLDSGVTMVRDLGSNWDIAVTVARAIDRGIVDGPTVVAAGRTVIMTGGHDPFWGIFSDGADAVTRAVRQQVSIGAGVLKTAATGGVYGQSEGEEIGQSELSYAELAVLAKEAHRFGKRVAAHALGTEGIRNAVRAGVDTIEHGVFLTEEIVEAMRTQGTVLCPTLATYRALAEGPEVPAYAAEKARTVVTAHRESFAMALDAGVPVIAGTDAGAPHIGHPSLVAELEMLHDYGLPLLDALRAGTSRAATALDRVGGVIQPGAPADLLIVEDDPFQSLANLRRVWGVVRRGTPVSALRNRVRHG